MILPAETLTIIYGLIAAVLTLVGLLSIFVSVNSQHNIQKCREIHWALMQRENKKDIFKDLLLYNDIYNDDEKFTQRVIKLSINTLYLVIGISAVVNSIFILKVSIIEKTVIISGSLIIYYLLIRFTIILKSLRTMHRVTSLPSTEEIVDADNFTMINTISLIAHSLTVQVVVDRFQEIKVRVGSTIPFNNVIISPSRMHFYIDMETEEDYFFDSSEDDEGLTFGEVRVEQSNTITDAINDMVNDSWKLYEPDLFKLILPDPLKIENSPKLSFEISISGKQGSADLTFEDIDLVELVGGYKNPDGSPRGSNTVNPTFITKKLFSSKNEYEADMENKKGLLEALKEVSLTIDN